MNHSSLSPEISASEFRRRAIARLSQTQPAQAFDPLLIPDKGDHQLAEMLAPTDGRLHRPAAVLVPIIAREAGATVLLTQRATHLKDHGGQIAFPGGKMDEHEIDPVETALREAEEEIGLERRYVQPIGYLDPYLSSTGFRIVPVIGMVEADHHVVINESEVALTFEVPLSFLMNAKNHETHSREWRGALRRYFAMPYREHYIWGVTAGIIHALYEKVYGA